MPLDIISYILIALNSFVLVWVLRLSTINKSLYREVLRRQDALDTQSTLLSNAATHLSGMLAVMDWEAIRDQIAAINPDELKEFRALIPEIKATIEKVNNATAKY